jgi:beta-galactosidase
LLPSRPPGPLANLAAMEVEEYFALDGNVPIKGSIFEGYVQLWAERLKTTGAYAIAMAKYKKANGWLDNQPAVTVSGILGSQGLIYYVGAYLDDESQQIFCDRLLQNAHLKPLNTPDNIEVRTRVRPDGQEIFFVINHSQEKKTVYLPWLAKDHLTDQLVDIELVLDPYGCAVLTKEEEPDES